MGTVELVDADHVEPVDTSVSTEWNKVVAYYKHVVELTTNVSTVEKIADVLHLIPARYIYDLNAGVYYRIVGNHFPWARPRFSEKTLVPPPAQDSFSVIASPTLVVV